MRQTDWRKIALMEDMYSAIAPIKDAPDIWEKPFDPIIKGVSVAYRCKRMRSLFKYIHTDGNVRYHDKTRFTCLRKDNRGACCWCGGLLDQLLSEQFPITMPYKPDLEPWRVCCTEECNDTGNEYFDTFGIWYILKPNGERVEIERFFKKNEDEWVKISRREYENRASRNT